MVQVLSKLTSSIILNIQQFTYEKDFINISAISMMLLVACDKNSDMQWEFIDSDNPEQQ